MQTENDEADTPSALTASDAGDEAETDRYAWLRQRTYLYLREQGGAAHEDAVIRHVFGAGSPPALWRTLIRTVLDDPATFRLRPDMHWALVEETPLPTTLGDLAGLGEYIVLDVETTGLRPFRQRLIEVCALKVRDGEIVDTFTTLLNPEKRVPAFITELTSISDEMVARAPRFKQIADGLLAFIGERLVVGHNVRFDVSFVNAELARAGKPPLVNPRLDTLSLAVRLLPGLRKPNLERMAQTLGVPREQRHRAEGDARLTAASLLRLLPMAQEAGLPTLEAIQALVVPHEAEPHGNASGVEKVGSGNAYLDRAFLRTVPQVPGVYRMLDEDGRIIYVGKAKNLHDRLASYYSQHLGLTRKMDGLLESVAKIEIEVVGSELEALLLESRLIHRHQPRYNRAMRNHALYPYIKVDIQRAWPRVHLARVARPDGARYFGPFRSRTAAQRTVAVLEEVLPLVTCTRGFSDPKKWGNPCIRLGMGKCLGPCVGQGDAAEYRAFIDDAVAFLEGRKDGIQRRLWDKMALAAEREDYTEAARLRDAIKTVEGIARTQQALARQVETGHLALALPSPEAGCAEVLLVVRGRVAAQRRVGANDTPASLAEWLQAAYRRVDELPAPPPPPARRKKAAKTDAETETEMPPTVHLVIAQDDVDEMHILERWLHHHAGEPGQFPLPDDRAGVSGWLPLAASLLAYNPAAEDWAAANLDAALADDEEDDVGDDAGNEAPDDE